MSDQQIKNIYPLTALQQGILFHCINEPESGVFIDQIHFEVELSDSQVAMFKQSWACLLDKHDVLRTAFIWKQIKQAVQVVKTNSELKWHCHDYSKFSADEQTSHFAQLLLKDRFMDFDLTHPPLCRQNLVKVDDASYRVIWTFHHLILDGWSVANLLAELKQAFADLQEGCVPQFNTTRPFSDYLDFLQAMPANGNTSFWKNYLRGFTVPTSFQKAKTSSQGSMRLAEQDIKLNADENAILLEFTRHNRLSMNTLVHAAWAILLMRYSGCDDVLYGATFSGRDPQINGIEDMVGVFINTLPVRVSRQNGQKITDWLQLIQHNLNELKDFEHDALSKIKRCSELDPQTSLFDCLLVVENYPNNSTDDDRLRNSPLRFGNVTHIEQSNYPCVLLMLPYKPIQFRIIYDGNRYSGQQVSDMLVQYRHCLLSLCNAAQKTVASFNVLPVQQSEKILQASLDDAYRFSFNTPVHHKIDSYSDRDDIAITAAYGDVSYSELSKLTDVLATKIVHQFDELNTKQEGAGSAIVAIYLDRNQRVIESMLAILKSGMSYVVIDPDYPKERINYLLNHSKASVCITTKQADLTIFNKNLTTIFIDQLESQALSTDADTGNKVAVNEASAAYVLYTSGSSGQPKGVEISHANLAYSTEVRSRVYPRQPKVYLLLSPFIFDSSVAGIYWALTTGGRLIVSEPRLEQNMQKLIDQIFQYQVTHTLCLPGLFELILEHAKASATVAKLQSLTTVILAGEAIASSTLIPLLRQLLPDASLYNEYGPTEATVWSSVYDLTQHSNGLPVPIGKAIPATQIVILDQSNQLLPIGVAGEICIAGPGVANGYLDAEDLTSEQFIDLQINSHVADPLYKRFYKTGDLGHMDVNANIIYQGRIDDQIKIRGHRLEPAEIEQALQLNPLVDDAIAIGIQLADADLDYDCNQLSELQLDTRIMTALAKLSKAEAEQLLQQSLNSQAV